jgi:hypothetical protein
MSKTVIQQLEDLLNQRDAQIEELETKVRELEDASERDWEWCRHRAAKQDTDPLLPLPRLEIRCVQETDDWYMWRWDYCFVYKHFLGQVIWVPLGQTRAQGGSGGPPRWAKEHVKEGRGEFQLPFREGVHVAHESETTGLPTFAILQGEYERISMREGKIHQESFKPAA